MNSRTIQLNKKQKTKPKTVGMRNAKNIHFKLCVSFLMVRSVVAQGRCMSVNKSMETAVKQVQPFCTSKVCRVARLPESVSVPCAV